MTSNPTFLALTVLPTLMLAAIVWIALRFEIRRKGGIRGVLANNIFKNPRGWARQTVGSHGRYRFMQSFTILMGVYLFGLIVALVFLLHHVYRTMTPLLVFAFISLGFGVVIVAAVQFPLMYLRALRRYVIDTQKEPNRSDQA